MVVYSKIKDLQIYLGKCIELENNKIERKWNKKFGVRVPRLYT